MKRSVVKRLQCIFVNVAFVVFFVMVTIFLHNKSPYLNKKYIIIRDPRTSEHLDTAQQSDQNAKTKTAEIKKLPYFEDDSLPESNAIQDEPSYFQSENPKLIKFIQDHYLNPPSKESYSLKKNGGAQFSWQAQEIRMLLGGKKNGIFVECRAYEGEFISNTLGLETTDDWTGALIEPYPESYGQLHSKHRKAWTIHACLSTNPRPEKKTLDLSGPDSKSDILESKGEKKSAQVQCFPVYSILLALNMTKIDYFSLSVDGSELDVLSTIPWHKVQITIFSVKFSHVRQGIDALKKYMKDQGYDIYIGSSQHEDFIFYHTVHLQNYIVENFLNNI